MIFAFGFPLLFICGAVFLVTGAFKGEKMSLHTMVDRIVTSSSYSDSGANVWYDESTGLETQQDYKNCILNRAQTIGLVADKKYGEKSITDLREIYNRINQAFKDVQ